MAPKTPSTTTQISEVKLPEWVDQAAQANYGLAEQISNQPYQPYTGDRIAGMTEMEKAAGGTLQGGIDTSNSALQAALAAAQGGAAFNPSQVQAGSFLDRDINAYMDPNINNVVNTTLQGMDRSIAQGQNQISSQAHGTGAFGGSRFGVQQAVHAAEGDRNKASTEAQLRSAAFQDAANRLTADNQTALQAAMANQNAGIAGAGLNLQAGQLAQGVGQSAADVAGRNALLQSQLGGIERGINQAGLDTAYSNFLEERDYPLEMLNTRLAALGMSPYGKSTDTQTTSNNSNSGSAALTGLGAMATILPILFGASDRKVKKNVKRIGKVPGSDLNAYEFEYKKGFMGHGPGKKVGLMAQDVEKKVPGAVHTAKDEAGKSFKVVDYGQALTKRPAIGIGTRRVA